MDSATTEAAADAVIEHAVHLALEAAISKPAKDYAKIVAAWVNDHLANTPAAANTAGWNHLTGTAIPALIAALAAA